MDNSPIDNWMHERVIKMEENLEQALEKLNAIDKTMALNTASLNEHMRRTAILEQELIPIREEISFVKRLGLLVSGVVGAIATLASIIYHLTK